MSRRSCCCIPGCYNMTGYTPGISFFLLPKAKWRKEKWIKFIGPDVRIGVTSKVCSAHFLPTAYTGLGQLKRHIIPTLNPPQIVKRSESSREKSSPANRESPTHSAEPFTEEPSQVMQIGNGESSSNSAEPFTEESSQVTQIDDGCTDVVTNQEMDESGVIDYVKQELCRVCGCKGDSLISIFENSSMKNAYNISVVKVLEMYLPLKIQDDDKLPSKICSKCLCMVNQWHELYITCVAADKTFRSMFCQGNLEEDRSEPVTRLPDKVVHFTICDESSMDNPVLKMKENVKENGYLKRSKSDDNVNNSNNSKDNTCINKVSGKEEKIEFPEVHRFKYPQFLCHYCGDLFDDRSSWRPHFKACKESLTICEKCGKTVRKKYLKVHKAQYHSTKKLCDQCGKRFYPRFLSSHLLTHCSETYYCNLCWKIFKRKSGHQRHLMRHEIGEIKTAYKVNTLQKEDKIVFVCPVCNLSFDDEHSVIIHLNQSKLVKCPVCRLKLNNEKLLYLHKCQKLTCQHCSRSFYNKAILMGHVRIHTGETPYKCKFCDLTFKTSTVRNAHQRSVHSKPTLKCAYCPKKYHVPSHLRYHMNIHEGVRYTCPICDKPFKRSDNMRKHIKIHKMG